MHTLAIKKQMTHSFSTVSAYDDEGVTADSISSQQRTENVELIIQRYFSDNNKFENSEREAIARSLNPGRYFKAQLQDEDDLVSGGFAPEMVAPSILVEEAFREYGQTELGSVALSRLITWDNQFIKMGWRKNDGSVTEEGIHAYGERKWRPFRVSSSGHDPDTVTPSGTLVLPDLFHEEYYSTGDISNPLAIIHHEIKAHVLPLKEARGLVPGREMELICIRLESEMLQELGLPKRYLNWGKDDGTLDHTLHESSENYYHGLVRYDNGGCLVEIDPEMDCIIGPARLKA